ncbi:MAG: von Willebrand factor type [Chthoniobacter sp.]|nr:von Willebrand factor type [Chthoniobacter sp.]
MTFAQPQWFWALLLLPLLLALFIGSEARRRKLLRTLVAARLEDRLAGTISVGKRRWRFALLLLAAAGAIVSLARPQYGFTWQHSQRKGRDVLIAIDVSRSMLANDLAPSRLARARLAAQDLIAQLEGDRVGLIAFAGNAFLQAPLTADFSAIMTSLEEFDVDLIPRGGTNLAEAIRVAVDAFGKGESDNRALVVFTDGEELDADGVKVATESRDLLRIFAVGLGSPEGSLIPVTGSAGGTEFVRDAKGEFVKSRLDEPRLQKIAEVTGGFYVRLQSGPAEMTRVVREGFQQMNEKEIDAKMARQPIEQYHWPLAVAIVALSGALLTGERRRSAWRAAAIRGVALVFLLLPLPAQAKSGAMAAYEQQDYKAAAELFAKEASRRPEVEALQFNLGSAAYKAGEYDRALEAFAKAVTSPEPQLRSKAEYNLANTLFQRGAAQKEKEPKVREWKNAVQHYDQALKVDPKNSNAEHNRNVVRKMLEELEKEQQSEKNEEQKKEEQKKDDKGEDPKDEKAGSEDQQSKGDKGEDQQPSKSGEEKQEPKSGEEKQSGDGQPKDSADGKPESGAEGKPQEPKPGESGKPQKDGKPDAGKEPGEPGEHAGDQKAQPPPGEAGKKPSGEVKAQASQEAGEPSAEEQAAAEAAAAAEGRMTEQQAKALLDSLKSEEGRVQLLRRERRGAAPVMKDW